MNNTKKMYHKMLITSYDSQVKENGLEYMEEIFPAKVVNELKEIDLYIEYDGYIKATTLTVLALENYTDLEKILLKVNKCKSIAEAADYLRTIVHLGETTVEDEIMITNKLILLVPTKYYNKIKDEFYTALSCVLSGLDYVTINLKRLCKSKGVTLKHLTNPHAIKDPVVQLIVYLFYILDTDIYAIFNTTYSSRDLYQSGILSYPIDDITTEITYVNLSQFSTTIDTYSAYKYLTYLAEHEQPETKEEIEQLYKDLRSVRGN